MISIPKVYVVDDDESVLRSLARFLRASGLAVEPFSSARSFMERETHEAPCCLVLDVHMPDMGGIELQQHLSENCCLMPVIFITGQADVPTCAEAMKHGAVDFLLKPFEQDVLLERIHQSLALASELQLRKATCLRARERLTLLTPREREVFDLVITGLLNKQIAAELGTSEKTVKSQRGQVTRKLGVQSVAEMLLLAQAAASPDVLSGNGTFVP